MFRVLVIACVVMFAAVPVLIATASVLVWLDARRVKRARRAGLTARARLDLERKLSDTRERVNVRVEILPVGENSYRWIAWDDDPMFEEQVEGVLVPYAAGMAPDLGHAEADARVAVFRNLEGRGRVTRIVLDPAKRAPLDDKDSPK